MTALEVKACALAIELRGQWMSVTDVQKIVEFATNLLKEAAHIAQDGCLVPPDGGSPTTEEYEMCQRIASRILALATPA